MRQGPHRRAARGGSELRSTPGRGPCDVAQQARRRRDRPRGARRAGLVADVGARGRSGTLIAADGAGEERIVELAAVPLTRHGKIGFQVENVLAAVAAVRALGVPDGVIRAGLATFVGDARQAPGRFNVRAFGDATVVMDYGHNPDALLALIDALGGLPHGHRSLVFTAAGDRRDIDIVRQGEIVADGFDRVVIYEDACNRGRSKGEVIALLRQGLARGHRLAESVELYGEESAIEMSLRRLRAGDLLVVLVDQVESSIAFIEKFLATEPPPCIGVANARELDVPVSGRKVALLG